MGARFFARENAHKSPFASLSILHTRKFFFSGSGVAKKLFKIYNDCSTQKRQESLFSADKTAVQKSRFAFSCMLGGKGSASKHVSNHFWRMLGSGADNLKYYFLLIQEKVHYRFWIIGLVLMKPFWRYSDENK